MTKQGVTIEEKGDRKAGEWATDEEGERRKK